MQPTCSNQRFLSCTLCPAWLGCVYEVDSEWNANTVFPIDTFLNVPQTVQPVLFYPPAPQCNLCFVIQWRSYAVEIQWNRLLIERFGLLWAASVSVAVGKLVDRMRVTKFTSTSVLTWYQSSQEFAKLINIKVITLPFYGSVLFYPSTECMSTECPVTYLL